MRYLTTHSFASTLGALVVFGCAAPACPNSAGSATGLSGSAKLGQEQEQEPLAHGKLTSKVPTRNASLSSQASFGAELVKTS